MGLIMTNKIDELLSVVKLNDLISKKEAEEKNKNTIIIILAIIGAIAAVAGIAFAVYKYLTPDYIDDFDSDDFYDSFDDDFIEFSDENGTDEDEE